LLCLQVIVDGVPHNFHKKADVFEGGKLVDDDRLTFQRNKL
jgi:hypothetical protein